MPENCGGEHILFFDLHVNHSLKLVEEAERLGYSGIALFKPERENNTLNNGEISYGDVLGDHSTTIYSGTLIQSRNPEDMKQKVKKSRKNSDVLMVRGGDQKINRAACEDPQVDVLSKPYFNRRDCGINHVMARKAAENDVAIELSIKHLTRTSSYLQYKVLTHFREILKLKRKYEFPLIMTSEAESIYDLHAPRDLVALAQCFGMHQEEAEDAVSGTPLNIIERSNTRGKVIVDGVKVVD